MLSSAGKQLKFILQKIFKILEKLFGGIWKSQEKM